MKYIIIIIIIIIILIAAIFSYLIIQNDRRKIQSVLHAVLAQIDHAIMGKTTEIHYDEALESAIGNKLNRYIQITRDMNDRSLQEKEAVKSLISDIAHQTKTPLSGILLLTQLVMEDETISQESQKMIHNIQVNAEKLNSLIHIMIHTSYLEGGLITVSPAFDRLSTVISDAVREIQASANAKNIRLSFIPSDVMCQYDYKWTKEAILNMIDNAIKYSPRNSSVYITMTQYELFARIDIKDEGPGISENEIANIFTRFYRSPESSRIEGVGVGLYLAREIIQKQGGYIKVNSVKGKGSVFSIFLPYDANLTDL